jgi:predicted aconitase
MTQAELRQIAQDSLVQFLASRHHDAVELTDDTDPISGLGLKSEDGVDWACDLEALGIEVPTKINPFVVDGQHPRPRRFGEIVQLLYGYVEHGEGARNE